MNVEIYVEDVLTVGKYVPLDLFDDESISLDFKLKDMRELDKVFTTYSRDFSVPASANNSKILNYFFDTALQRTSDRFLRCKIYVNTKLFRIGEITSTEGVYNDNRISSYKVSFSTGLTSIKDKIGDDMLRDLDFSDIDFTWSELNIKNTIESNEVGSKVLVPLISRDKVWTIEGNSNDNISTLGNIGLSELRPALKLSTIYNKVVQKYNLNFNFPFLESLMFKQMYVWLNNESTSNTDETKLIITKPFINSTGGYNATLSSIYQGGFKVENVTNNRYFLQVELNNPKDPFTNDVYLGKVTIKIVRNDGVEYTTTLDNTDINSNRFDFRIIPEKFTTGSTNSYQIYISSDKEISFTSFNVIVRPTSFTTIPNYQRSYDNPSPLMSASFNFSKSLGDIKVIDFLSSMFKSVNAIFLERQDSSTLDILTEKDIVKSIIDITPYVDTTNFTKIPTVNYKTLTFTHSEAKYLRNIEYLNIVGKEYGSEVYVSSDSRLGGSYDVKTEFNIMNYFMLDSSSIKTSYGFETEGNPNKNAKLTILIDEGSYSLYKYTDEGVSNFTINLGKRESPLKLSKYRRFGNQATNGDSFTFDIDINPDGQVPMVESLYKNYYSSYISKMYHPNARVMSIPAYIPTTVLNSFKMVDRLVIGSEVFEIEEATIDITSGKTNFKLLNLPSDVGSITPPPNIVKNFILYGEEEKIRATWLTDSSIDKFYLEYKETDSTAGFHTTRVLPNNVGTHTYIDLYPNTYYDARIRTLGFDGVFSEWVYATAKTVAGEDNWVKPVKLLNVSAYDFNQLTVNFNGSDAKLGVKGHWLYWKQLPNGVVQKRWVAQINNNQVSYSQTISNLLPDTQYEISVVTEDYQGNQSEPKTIVAKTLEGGLLYPPQLISAQPNYNSILLQYSMIESNVIKTSHFVTEYAFAEESWNSNRPLQTKINGAITDINITGLTEGSKYKIRTKAVGFDGKSSDYSEVLEIYTKIK